MPGSEVDLAHRSVLELIRCGEMPDDEDLDTFHRSEIVDSLRRFVEVEDLEWLLPAIATSQERRLPFLISLVAAHSARPEVQRTLRQRWHISSVYIQSVLMWRLLDDPLLPMEWHRRLFAFTLAEWELFAQEGLRFFGGTEESLLARALDRYCNPQLPDSKKWAYLCCIACVTSYPSAVEALLELATTGSNAFLREVALNLRHR